MKDVSKIEGKTKFMRRLKQIDGLTWLTPTPLFYDRSTPLRAKMTARHSTAVSCRRAASVGQLPDLTASLLCLIDISGCPPYTSLNRRWPSLPGRRSACMERSATACYFR